MPPDYAALRPAPDDQATAICELMLELLDKLADHDLATVVRRQPAFGDALLAAPTEEWP